MAQERGLLEALCRVTRSKLIIIAIAIIIDYGSDHFRNDGTGFAKAWVCQEFFTLKIGR